MSQLKNKVAIVTGSATGLGAAVALQLADKGCNVVINYTKSETEAKETLAACEAKGVEALLAQGDVGEDADCRRIVDETVKKWGRVDVLVNNAGIIETAELEALTEDALDAMWSVNVKAPFRMIRLALPHLRTDGSGRVVSIASLSGLRVMGTFAPGSAMSKHAVLALSEATKQAGWDDGIRVTSVCPGFIATDMTNDYGGDQAMMIDAADLAELISTTISLPNTASVAQLNVACRLEPHF